MRMRYQPSFEHLGAVDSPEGNTVAERSDPSRILSMLYCWYDIVRTLQLHPDEECVRIYMTNHHIEHEVLQSPDIVAYRQEREELIRNHITHMVVNRMQRFHRMLVYPEGPSGHPPLFMDHRNLALTVTPDVDECLDRVLSCSLSDSRTGNLRFRNTLDNLRQTMLRSLMELNDCSHRGTVKRSSVRGLHRIKIQKFDNRIAQTQLRYPSMVDQQRLPLMATALQCYALLFMSQCYLFTNEDSAYNWREILQPDNIHDYTNLVPFRDISPLAAAAIIPGGVYTVRKPVFSSYIISDSMRLLRYQDELEKWYHRCFTNQQKKEALQKEKDIS